MKGLAGSRVADRAAVLVLFLACGCAGGRTLRPPTETAVEPPYDVASEGRFPPAPVVETAPAGAVLSAGEETKPRDLEVAHNVSEPRAAHTEDRATRPLGVADSTTPRRTSAAGAATSDAARFRVQVFAGRSRAVAERVRDEVMATVDVRAYIDFIDPYYKVQVGDCPTRNACRGLEERLRQRGYESPWTVPVRIRP